MEITSLVFLTFVLLTLLFYYLLPKRFQWVVLLCASLFFFVASSALLTLYMLFSTLVIYCGAISIERYKNEFVLKKKELPKPERKVLKQQIKKKQKIVLVLCAAIVIAVLIFTKYINFLGNIINMFSGLFSLNQIIPKFSILLPIGISYYTLMSVSYITDVYRDVIPAEKNPLRVLLFVCYFPHIIEGPFDRYKDLNLQFREHHIFNYDKIRMGVILVMYGFFKKLVIADRIGIIVPNIFANIDNYSGTGVFAGMILYTFQLYADFSGCIDIITGISEMFDIKVAENFRQPFFAKSIDEFWRRWHISLGAWLKEYVFYPVSLSKQFKKVNFFAKNHIKSQHLASFISIAYALFFVWFFNGLWHGASLKYIIYGLYYYVLMMTGRLFEPVFNFIIAKVHINIRSVPYKAFQIFRTFLIVNVGMLLFRCSTLIDFGNLFLKMVTSINISDLSNLFSSRVDALIIFVGFIMLLVVGIMKEKNKNIRMWLVNYTFAVRWVVYLFFIVTTLVMGIYGVEYGEAAAIYAQF